MTPLTEQQYGVFLDHRMIGRLHQRDDVTRFVFEDDYWNDPARAILGLRFEDDPRAPYRSKMRLPPWFSNLLPEGRLRDWIARARDVSPQREMELLAQVGHDLPGAVQVRTLDSAAPSDMHLESEHPSSSDAGPFSIWRFSLAGVGLKFSMLARGEHLTIPAVNESGDWILKLPESQFQNVPLNEFAMMTLATAIGINTPEIRLVHRDLIGPLPDNAWPSKEDRAYAVKRFDRGPGREPIHIEDMAQVRGFYPERKYHGSFETIAALIYRGQDSAGLREFARRMTFNILIGNGDAHLKNWSLIYLNPRKPTLAPAYDLVSTTVYQPNQYQPEDLGLKFGNSKRFDSVRISTFDRLEQKLGIRAELSEIARETIDLVTREWPRAESILSVDKSLVDSIRAFIKARAHQLCRKQNTGS